MEIKEILVLHRSHFDYGFTHTPPVLWELQREFIDSSYGFRTHGPFDALRATREGRSYVTPIEMHPAINCKVEERARFFECGGVGKDFRCLSAFSLILCAALR